MVEFAQLHTLSNFSFQRGASHPEELVERAHELGYRSLALTDSASLAGIVRAHVRAKALGLHLIVGAEIRLVTHHAPATGCTLLLLAPCRRAYGQLCALLSHLRQHPCPSGPTPADRLPVHGTLDTWPPTDGPVDDLLCVWLPWSQPLISTTPPHHWAATLQPQADWLQGHFGPRAWVGVALDGEVHDSAWLATLQAVGQQAGLPLVAASAALMHHPRRKPLLDVLAATRLHRPLDACGTALEAHAQRHLRRFDWLAQRYPSELLAETVQIAQRCHFSLDELRYEYPQEVVPEGCTPTSHLRAEVARGLHQRYRRPETALAPPPQPLDPKGHPASHLPCTPSDMASGIPAEVQALADKELALIEELGFEKYFLTVHDIVQFARSRGILCQGRGSAANSVVCYSLGITEVDPARSQVLFERFISRERREPPDIDVDFEHERREEVIQYLYSKYGRHRAALAAAVIRYQPRSALRDVGKALGVPPQTLDTLSRLHRWWDATPWTNERLREAGLDPASPQSHWLVRLSRELIGFPRHLSQHSGGFVLSGAPLTQTVPVIPAAMTGRTTIEWDKDDIDALGLLKVDVLALGMLSALRRALALVSERRQRPFGLADIPPEDPDTYDMISGADTVGVFQIESRAQMSMLPRLQPRCFYDLVVEVAIVRPGPIQGGMVHPYLQARERQRQGLPLTLPNEALRPALERTLGIPIFQEQVMQIAIIAAGFSPGEADALRRSMAAWRRKGGIDAFHDRLVQGMLARGYDPEFAEAIFRQIEGFGEYGFPESHAASFALLVYASAWLKRHEPACFLVALLNAQPMGFYGPAQLVQDARRHGVTVHPVDVLHSHWDCQLEGAAVRLGLRLVAGLSRTGAERWLEARSRTPVPPSGWTVPLLAQAARLGRGDLHALAAADALRSLSGHRRQQLWASDGQQASPPALWSDSPPEAPWQPPAPAEFDDVLADYASTGLSLRRHPVAFVRPLLARQRIWTAEHLRGQPDGRLVRAAGLVTTRQRPGSASGVMFLTLEDETGCVQVVIWPSLQERFGHALLRAKLLAVHGRWEREGEVTHLVAGHVRDLSDCLADLSTRSRDFR